MRLRRELFAELVSILIALAIVALIQFLSGCKEPTPPAPMTDGRCSVDAYNASSPSGYACEYQGFVWYCTPGDFGTWSCARGPALSAEAR